MFLKGNGKPGAEEEIQALLDDIVLSAKAADHIELPDMIVEDIPVLLDDAAAKAYRTMELQMLLEVDGETIYKYAVSFREGNRSTFFRGAVMTLMISGSIAGLFLSHGPAAAIIEIVIAAAAAYLLLPT